MFQAGNSVSAEISERQKEKNAKERKKGTQQWSNRDRDSRERDRDSTAIDMETEKSRLKDRIVIQSMGRGGGDWVTVRVDGMLPLTELRS